MVIKASPYHFNLMCKTTRAGWVSSDLLNAQGRESQLCSCLTSRFWINRLHFQKSALFLETHLEKFTTDSLLTGQGGGGLFGGSGRGFGTTECCEWVLVPSEGRGRGPEGGGGAWFRLCSDLEWGAWGEYCLWGEVTGLVCGWAVCSFGTVAYAGTGGGFSAGRTIEFLERAGQDGLGRGEDFPWGRRQT